MIVVIFNMISLPKNRIESTVPVAAEINNGIIVAAVKSIISTSMANVIAATGAINTAAIAAVEPQASNKEVFFALRLNKRARLDPIAEPVSTMGASIPTVRPIPTVIELATIEV